MVGEGWSDVSFGRSHSSCSRYFGLTDPGVAAKEPKLRSRIVYGLKMWFWLYNRDRLCLGRPEHLSVSEHNVFTGRVETGLYAPR